MKKAVALILSLALLTGSAAAAESAPAWAAEAYEYLGSVYIHPQNAGAITRGQFVDLLVDLLTAALPSRVLDQVSPVAEGYFSDNYPQGSALAQAMEQGAAFGIVEGWVDDQGVRHGNFQSTLTRQEAAKMVCSTLDFFTAQGYEIAAPQDPAAYTDADAIAAWAAPFTGRVAAYGIMYGDHERRFLPTGELDWPSSAVLASRTLKLMEAAVVQAQDVLVLDSALDWSGANVSTDYAVSKPLTGYYPGTSPIDNGDGTFSALLVPSRQLTYANGSFSYVASESFYVERYDEDGNLVSSKTLPMELPIFGAFLDGGDHFYLAFGQMNEDQDDDREVWRVVQYDRDWNRIGSVSLTGKDTYTTEPFRSTVARMALTDDGKTLALYAARTRYDGHQSNIYFQFTTQPFALREVKGEAYPDNHVSHSFGQFVRFDGDTAVTVDHGDAFPRSFLLQSGGKTQTLLSIAGNAGENVTHAIGSGFEVSDSGYLFLGCSAPQKDFAAEDAAPWNVFLTYTDKNLRKTTLTWLTDSDATIDTARLVKLGEDDFLAMWGLSGSVHCQRLNGKGEKVGEETVLDATPMPLTQPIVSDGAVVWLQLSTQPLLKGKPCLYRLEWEKAE